MLTSHARELFPPVTFSTATLTFNEQIPEIVVEHTDTGSEAIQKFAGNVTRGDADLSFRPGQTKVFEFSYTPVAQAQIEVPPFLFVVIDGKVVSLSLTLESEGYEFKLVFPFLEMGLSSLDGSWHSGRIRL